MEIMMAIYESLRIKNVVKMPLKTRELPLEFNGGRWDTAGVQAGTL